MGLLAMLLMKVAVNPAEKTALISKTLQVNIPARRRIW